MIEAAAERTASSWCNRVVDILCAGNLCSLAAGYDCSPLETDEEGTSCDDGGGNEGSASASGGRTSISYWST